jgi:hypothetical protein
MDGNDRIDARALIGSMGRVAAAFTAAAGDFWGRSWENGTGRLVNTLLATIGVAAEQPARLANVQMLLRHYGDWLGEVALAASLAAQTFQRHVAAQPERRLLFCAAGFEAVPTAAVQSGLPQLDLLLPVSRAGAKALAKELLETLSSISTEYEAPAEALDDFAEGLVRALSATGADVERISRLLTQLAQAYKAKQTDRFAALRSARVEVLGESGSDYGVLPLQRFEEMLGANVMPSVRNTDVLHQLMNAFGTSAPEITVTADLQQQLHEAFGGAGIELSESLSIASGYRDWILRDHGKDRTFHVLREGNRLEVYGEVEGKAYRVADTRVLLPARVHDASHGSAVYLVPKDIVQDLLDLHQPRALQTWDVGSGRTPVQIFIVDYRDSDLGSYRELGMACFAAPKNSPLAVGMHILELPVTDRFSCDAGRHIWGYPKTLYDLDFTYRDNTVTSTLIKRGSPAQKLFALTLPRAGAGSSRNVPIYNYTVKRGMHHRTIFTRSGRGEGIQWGSRAVRLEVHANVADSALNTLQSLGLPGRTPIFSSWTERMTGEFGMPSVLTATA